MTQTATAEAPAFGREFTAARQSQGFKSQAHLDAFYAHLDHGKACTECGVGASILTDDGWQGTRSECDEAVRLFLASIQF